MSSAAKSTTDAHCRLELKGGLLPNPDPLADILGDYCAFFSRQRGRLRDLGISIDGCELSHLAFRTLTYPEYLDARDALEKHAAANRENVWNGRLISKILLRTPLLLEDGFTVPMIELIPPMHQCVYRMGLEHLGVVVGERIDDFSRANRAGLTGQQFQSPVNEPYFVRFPDHTNVKFYLRSLKDACTMEGRALEGFTHGIHWQG